MDQLWAARQAAGERVRILTSADGRRAVYSRAEAGLAWYATGGRQVGTVRALIGLAVVLAVLCGGLFVGAWRVGMASSAGIACLVFAGLVLVGLLWLVVLLRLETRAAGLRRRAGLPDPV